MQHHFYIHKLNSVIKISHYEQETVVRNLVTVLPEIAFLIVVENISFCFRHSYFSNASLFKFNADFLKFS